MKGLISPAAGRLNSVPFLNLWCKRSALGGKPLCWRRAGEKGTTLIEFAIAVPVLFMLLLGFCQICLAIYSNFCVNETARETARWASVRGSNSCADAPQMTDCDATADAIASHAKEIGYPGIKSTSLSVSTTWLQASSTTPVTWSACSGSHEICDAPGNAVQIVVSYPFLFQIPFSNANIFNFSSTAQMVIVQ
jgi:Flp pilus assembly protein TadG